MGEDDGELAKFDITNVTGHSPGNPETRAEGTGTPRVHKFKPGPLPQRTLPVTRAGFATRDNH